MVRTLLFAASVSLISVAAVAPAAYACDEHAEAAGPAVVTPAEAQAMLAAGAKAVDVNRAETRAELGTLPEAILLSGAEYAEGELPADRDAALVFYCGSERCSAAPSAAATAVEQGYTNVSVMAAGIRGWVAEGLPTQAPGSSK